ncbi:hypothetical protein [Luteococcus peritonei]|uniref:Uncharacterized protein n=1 Tax=Luteococcus peritonei TaxID=88874 RepID=A0ABW4RXM1_9ACTN
MSSAIGISLLAAFALGLFILVPFLLAPLVLGAAWLQRRHQLAATTPASERITLPLADQPRRVAVGDEVDVLAVETEEQDQPEAPARQGTSLEDGDQVEEPREQAAEGQAPVVASTSMLTQAA